MDKLEFPGGGGQLYQAMLQYLEGRKATPQLQTANLRDGVGGSFEYDTAFGKGLPPEGVVFVNEGRSDRTEQGIRRTLAHELAHATDRQLAEQYFSLPKGARGADQFGDAFQKLVLDSEGGRSSRNRYAGRLAGEPWAKGNIDYRAGSSELAGFGAGSTEAPNRDYPAPLHVDPTMATELSILLELAQRKRPAK